jgi:hypothetical protein
MEFREFMEQKSNEELIDLIFVHAYNYQENAVIAAEEVLKHRNISNLDEIRKQISEKHFKDLSSYPDKKLLAYLLQLHFNKNKSINEIKHILKMGNLQEARITNLMQEFELEKNEKKSSNSSFKKFVGFALFFGGIAFSVLSYHSVAQTGGTYFVAFGAIAAGVVLFFELI